MSKRSPRASTLPFTSVPSAASSYSQHRAKWTRVVKALAFLGAAALSAPTSFANEKPPQEIFGAVWKAFGRAEVTKAADTVTVANGSLANLEPRQDMVMSFTARAVDVKEPVQIWGAVRVKDRENRYVFGLRGGVEPQISFARYAADGASRNLGFSFLEEVPRPGEWYRLRIVCVGRHFHIYLNEELLPRINIKDDGNGWDDGGVALGGGWLPAEFKDFEVRAPTEEELAAFRSVGSKTFAKPQSDKEAVRASQRSAWRNIKIGDLPETRGEFSLDSDWLFMPEGKVDGAAAVSSDDDINWHVMKVPAFWTFSYCWLYGEDGFSDLKGAAAYRSPSDKATQLELDRLEALTFDWRNTKAGWYRQKIELPEKIEGRHFQLVFDAIAKISEIWVNGQKVGWNTGMFSQIDCDITSAVKPGSNLVTVYVKANLDKPVANADRAETEAVTVKVTNDMMYSLPRGMMQNGAAGIWQPVRLVVTSPVRVGDVFVQTTTEQASADVEMLNSSSKAVEANLSYEIRDWKDNTVLFSGEPAAVSIPGNGKTATKIQTPKLVPKLWSPRSPNLYKVVFKLSGGDRLLDEKEIRFGFRTFVADGNRFLLNGQPYWLRGANHTPAILKPNDGELARKFYKLSQEGNIWLTRSHCQPFTQAWLDAADEVGMGVSLEGTWPWLMIKGEPPPSEMIDIWREEFIGLIRRYHNHPSILMWTINNEMNFSKFDEKDPPLLKRKWEILDRVIKEMRATDPTRPISAYSGYARELSKKGYKEVVETNGFDDGDIDDIHTYNGWYNPSFFTFYNGEFGKRYGTVGRPLISQEISTGYPRSDGWAARSYIYNRYTAQALVGNYAFEQNDPSIFLTRQALMTKELTETIRRTSRNFCAGLMPFSYVTWFRDVWIPDKIQPLPTYYAIGKAMQPVLVSAELYGRHFYAGDKITRRVCVANDAEDGKATSAGTLAWEIRDGASVLWKGEVPVPSVEYYADHWIDVDFQIPANLPVPRVNAKLFLKLTADGRTLGANDYDIVVAKREWAVRESAQPLAVFDPAGKLKKALAGYPTQSVTLDGLTGINSLVVGDLPALLADPQGTSALLSFVKNGGCVLLLNPGEALGKLLPDQIKSYRAIRGEIVNMVAPESPVFDGLEPLDLAWFETGTRSTPIACTGTWEVNRNQPGVEVLANQCDFHTEILFGPQKVKPFFSVAGAPIVQVGLGTGMILASEMALTATDRDPVAARLLANLIDVAGRVKIKNRSTPASP